MRKVLGLSLLAALCGCQLSPSTPLSDGGPSDGGDRSFTGSATLSGPTAFAARGALEGRNVNAQGQLTGFSAFITDHGLSCAALDGGPLALAFHQVQLGVVSAQPNGGPPAGSYQVLQSFPPGGGFAAFVAQTTFFGDGGRDGPYLATSGTVTFSIASPDHIAGNFDVLVPTDGGALQQLSGTFDAPYCP